jgi:hypothetical protein
MLLKLRLRDKREKSEIGLTKIIAPSYVLRLRDKEKKS